VTNSVKRQYSFQKKRWKYLVGALDVVGDLCLQSKASLPSKAWNQILVMRLDHLGDGILLTPLLRELRRNYPDAKIAGLFSKEVSQVVSPALGLDKVWTLEKHWFSRESPCLWSDEIAGVLKEIRTTGFDIALDPRGDLRNIYFLKRTGIPHRLGYGSSGGGFWLTHELEERCGQHEVDRNLRLLSEMGGEIHSRHPEVPVGVIPADFPKDSRVLAMHVGAGSSAKRWSRAYWRDLVDHFTAQGFTIALLGKGSVDREFSVEFTGRHDVWLGVDRLSFTESLACIQQSNAFIGIDSGLAHGSASLGVPTCVIESGTNEPERWSAIGEKVKTIRYPVYCSPCHLRECPFQEHACMQSIKPGEVVEILNNLLKEDSHA